MDGTEIALRFVGAFYTFAGLVTARAALTSNLIDKAISAITLKKTDRIDTHRTIWLVSLSILIFAGGVALLLLLEPAAWLFGAAALVQAVYFAILGPFYFDIADPPDPLGRRRSINAFVIYCASTAYVVWAAYVGRLIPIASASGILLGAGIAAIALQIGYVARHMLWAPKRQSAFGGFDDDGAEPDTEGDDAGRDVDGLAASSKRIKLMADYGIYPLWSMDDGLVGNIAPQDLGVSDELSADLLTWASEFDMSLDTDNPAVSRWTAERRREHAAQGIALARRIKREFPDREVFVHDESGELVEVDAPATAPE
jgi:hypothetical protein